jgi:glycosyltransferase involved in cell wall biosynthesis
MLARARIAVIVPAFNVASRVGAVLRTMPPIVDHVVVVDDGSVDGTSAAVRAARDPRVTLLQHDHNRGVGAAIATGYAAAIAHDCDVMAVMAGDGQMDPRDLPPLIDAVANGRADYAKGNRLRHPDVMRAMPSARLIGNLLLSALTRIATGLWHIGDSQCGYTAIHRRVFASLDAAQMWARYGYPNHLLGALARGGFRVADVTVRPVYDGEPSGVRVRDALVTIPRILLYVAIARLRDRVALHRAERSAFVELP